MPMFQRLASLATLGGVLVLFTAPASAVALIRNQAPCFIGGGIQACKKFRAATLPTKSRGFSFSAPSAGRAAVSITGSMFCDDISDVPGQRVVDLVTQIVPTAGAVPNLAGPSAIRHVARVGASGGDGFGLSTSFNLASTRVFGINAAGAQQYHFNMRALRMDPRMDVRSTTLPSR